MKREGIDYAKAVDHVSGLTQEQIDEYAATAADRLNFAVGGDMAALVKNLGGRVQYQNPFESNAFDEDTIIVHGEKDFDIVLSSISSAYRDRFTIAHEIGHYLLHSQQGRVPLVATRSGSNRAEWEANWFAAGFLMPAKEFRKACKSGKSNFELAAMFSVSEMAAEVRTKALRLK